MLSTEILERTRIPEAHWRARMVEIPDHCEHREKVQGYLDDILANVRRPKGLLLTGPFGSGKSAIGSIILKAAAAQGFIGLWITARKLPGHVIEKTPFDDEQNLYERAQTVPVLIIDEVQLNKAVRYSEQIVETLVRHRVDARLATILTTNHLRSEIENIYPGLHAALMEAVVHVKVGGHNFRDAIQEGLVG